MRKIISVLLTAAMLAGSLPAFAAEANTYSDSMADVPLELEDVGTSEMTSPKQISEVAADEESETTSEPDEYEPIKHEETVDDMFEFPEKGENLMPVDLPEAGEISLFSLDTDDSSMWQSMYAKMFGDDY